MHFSYRWNVVLLYTSKYHDIHRVINVSGRYNTEGGVEERLGKGYLQKVKKMVLSTLLTVHGSDDSIVGVEEALEFAKIIPNHKLHVIEGADHGSLSIKLKLYPFE
ncbi:hypothetical protein L1887_23233 [Cichorium endivia]|nr:hypothetical protein L1887_23233 [Cichorium endivia]